MHPYSVIIKPAVSEKSNDLREDEGKYTFLIRMSATKEDVKKAVKEIWGLDAVKVATNIRRGKVKRRAAKLTSPKKSKRAVVTLKKGDKIPLFEEQ